MDRQKLTRQIKQKPLLAIAIGVAALAFLVAHCNRPDPFVPGAPTEESVRDSLKPDEERKIVIGDNRVVDVTRTKGRTKYVPPEGRTEVIIKKDGSVNVKTKVRGFTIRPGVGAATFGGDFAPILDCKLAYYSRLGFTVGTGLTKGTFARPYAGISYNVWGNTAGFIGYSVKKDIVVGLRVSF